MFEGTLREFLQYIKENKKKILCFGTGLMAEEALKHKEIREAVVYCIDNAAQKQGKTILLQGIEYLVIKPEDIMQHFDDKTCLLVTSGYYRDIIYQLNHMTLPEELEIYSYPHLKVNYASDSWEFFENRILNECIREYESVLEQNNIFGKQREKLVQEKKKFIIGKEGEERPLVLPRVMIMPTTRCNLRCKGCSSLLPMFESPADVDISQNIKDLEMFFSAIDECIRITIGGEPFLYPHLKEMLEYLIHQKKVLGIMLITNSTIIPSEDIVDLLKNPKIMVEISDYGHLERMSRLIALFERQGIIFKVLTEQTWTDMGGVQYRNRTKEELQFSYLNCEQSRLMKGIHNGKFHTCARSARMHGLGAYEAEEDYFDLSQGESVDGIREKIKKLYYSNYAEACNYCDLGTLPNKIIEAGIQITGNMKKSAYTIVNREEYEHLKQQAILKESYEKG